MTHDEGIRTTAFQHKCKKMLQHGLARFIRCIDPLLLLWF